MSLENKTAIITGGATGIGLAIAKTFYQAGANLVLCGRRKGKLEQAQKEIHKVGKNKILIKTTDVIKERELDELIDFTIEQTGKIDILVNNAGYMNFANAEFTTKEMLEVTFAVNTFAPFNLMQKVLPYMKKQGQGNIINISSFAGLQAIPETSAYCASKAALQMLSQVIALEAAEFNVRINCICPDVIENTELANSIFGENNVAEKFYQPSRHLHPIARNGTPLDVANLALFLAVDSSSWITGVNIPLDGGRLICTNRNKY